jgi:hypothetical protein
MVRRSARPFATRLRKIAGLGILAFAPPLWVLPFEPPLGVLVAALFLATLFNGPVLGVPTSRMAVAA